MFEYRYPLLEVIQAIDELRESRGTTNKQICDFVRQQGRNPNDPMKILKTIRTLNKLVEEGVLIKKGKRYVFPTKPPELADNADDNDDEDEQDQDNNQDGDSCDENDDDEDDDDEEGEGNGDEGEEEQDDDDDDDEEEEEDDDEDDEEDEDEECDDKEEMPESEGKSPSGQENTTSRGLSQQKSPLNSGEPKPNENVAGNEERTDKVTSNTSDNNVTKKNSLKGGRKNGKGQNGCETKNNGKNKGGEAIAFCARDFIDSQYCQNSTQAKPVSLHEKPQDDLIEIENFDNEPVARVFGMKKRESKSRKIRGNDCRSRSPIRRHVKNDFFTDLKLNHSQELSSQIFQELTDTPMDIDHDNEVVDLDYDILRHRSPIGPTSPIAPGVQLDRTESCCSQPNDKSPKIIKAEPDFDCKTQFFLKKNGDFKHSRHSMARAIDMQCKRLAAKEAAEKDKEKHEGHAIKAENRTSLCSICEKKKRNS